MVESDTTPTTGSLEAPEARKALLDDLRSTHAVTNAQFYRVEDERGDEVMAATINLGTDSIPTDVMRVLSDWGLSITPTGPGELFAKPEREGIMFTMTPEVWAMLIERSEYLDDLLNTPGDLAEFAQERVVQDEGFWADHEDFSAVVDELEKLQTVLDIFVGKLSDEMRDAILDSVDLDEFDEEDFEDGFDFETVRGMPASGVQLANSPDELAEFLGQRSNGEA